MFKAQHTWCCSIIKSESSATNLPSAHLWKYQLWHPARLQLWWETNHKMRQWTYSEVFSVTKRKMIWPGWESPRCLPATLLTQHSILQPLYGNTFMIEGPQLRSVHLDSSRVVKTVICFFIPATMTATKNFPGLSSTERWRANQVQFNLDWSSLCDKVLFRPSA